MSQGWISLHRKIEAHWLHPANEKREFTKLEAWLDILLMVNHKSGKVMFNDKLVEIGEGQRITSIKHLAERWKWSRKKVSNFLNLLEKEHQIEQKRTSKMTLLTVVNYGFYQREEGRKEHRKVEKGTTKEHQKNTNNNVNNDNKKPLRHKYEPCDMESAQYLFSLMLENNPTAKQPNFDKWANDFRLIRERDKRSVPEIKRLIEWTQNDEFWKGNILSPSSLRKQWDRLILKVDSKPKRQENTSNALSGVANEWEALLKND